MQRWEGSSWWSEVRREAADRWLTGMVGRARHALLRALNEPDGNLALKVLERAVPEDSLVRDNEILQLPPGQEEKTED